MDIDLLRRQFLAARDARAATILHRAATLPEGQSLVVLSLNIPGPGKTSARLEHVFERALRKAGALRHDVGDVRTSVESSDALGHWAVVTADGRPEVVKRACVALEERLSAGRLLDLDVFASGGRQIDRQSLGLPARRCLACDQPAFDCIRAARHSAEELEMAVERLVHADECVCLADALVEGARIELELTPKPGLVDRRDNGSHPDLSFAQMERSIALLPQYYDELLGIAAGRGLVASGFSRAPEPDVASGFSPTLQSPAEAGFHVEELGIAACIAAGQRAEQRMIETVGTNAHRGYIFLSGLVLLAFARITDRRDACPTEEALRAGIVDLARRIAAARPGPDGTHGAGARARHGAGGILAEALAGLPAVFEHGLPALERALTRFGVKTSGTHVLHLASERCRTTVRGCRPDAAHHYLMAVLMTQVEDTTTLHRAGPEGLKRLRKDGRRILEVINAGGDYVALLERLNEEYRAAGLTMGGVADCVAITVGLRLAACG